MPPVYASITRQNTIKTVPILPANGKMLLNWGCYCKMAKNENQHKVMSYFKGWSFA